MAVTIEMQNTGDSRARREILAGVEHVLSDVAGEWRVSIVGSRADDNWEMKYWARAEVSLRARSTHVLVEVREGISEKERRP